MLNETNMFVIEDDEQMYPNVSEAQSQFVLHLNDTYKTYARFIAALLIPRPSYEPFFRDLKAFRSQPTIISLLYPSTQTKEEAKRRYRETTTLFLQSRWSHPWCREAAGNRDLTVRSTGWWSSEWSSTGRRMGKKEQLAEDRLHQLLLPIWVIMRGRMFPGNEIVQDWWAKKQEMDLMAKQHQTNSEFEQGVLTWLDKAGSESNVREIHVAESSNTSISDHENSLSPVSSNPFRTGGEHTLRPVKTTPNLRQEFWDSDEAGQMQIDLMKREQESARMAATAFQLLAAGMFISKIPKWKLRRLRKAST